MTATPDPGPATMTEADVYSVYVLALGRLPEAASVVASRVGGDRAMTIRSFFATEEHASNVLVPVENGLRPAGGLFDQEPGAALCAWAEATLPMSAGCASAVREAAGSWNRLYAALFADETFQNFIGAPLAFRLKALAATLARLGDVEGGITRLDETGLKGWVKAATETGPRTVEASVAGEVVAIGLAREFRRDVQERFGGDGIAGFTLTLDERLLADPRRPTVEVRDQASGLFLGSVALTARAAPLSVHHRLMREVAAVRGLLERIEAALPLVRSDLAFDLADYGDWYEVHVRPFRRGPAVRSKAPARVLVTLDARAAPMSWVGDALQSLEDQTIAEWAVLMVGEGVELEDLATRTTWRSGRPVTVVSPEVAADPKTLPPRIEAVVRLSALGVLEPEALETILAKLKTKPAPDALFWDEDVLEPQTDGTTPAAERRRREPWLKGRFDMDLLLQEPALGSGLALSRASLTAIGQGAWIDADASAAALALVEAGRRPTHLPRILQSRQRPFQLDAERWAGVVQAHLERTSPGARAEVASDAVGAPGAVRVESPESLAGVAVSVIVPTRDRLDLLKPCIDSLLEARPSNAVTMDLIIVDHMSQEPEARAYIDGLVAAGAARVMPYEGAFNWALMNNMAAARSEADVLVFLNNDTVVISPDWLDRLCRQALRPEVGVVGARLVYADGTIQHAGFVGRALPDSFITPEGMGVPASDGGYRGRHARLRRAAAVTGACMAVRADVFRRVGGFDAANLPVDWNDIDLCLKVRAEGLEVMYEPAAALYHFESKSRGVTQGGDRVTASMRAAALAQSRWGTRFAEDGNYNPLFDRLSAPFARLGARPSSDGGAA